MSRCCFWALPEGAGWAYELKLDGLPRTRDQNRREVRLRSRNDKDFNRKYPGIAKALASLPDETVVDGEVVALDEARRPSFNALQNGAAGATIVYYVFDVMVLGGRNVMGEPLATRRQLLTLRVVPCDQTGVADSPTLVASPTRCLSCSSDRSRRV